MVSELLPKYLNISGKTKLCIFVAKFERNVSFPGEGKRDASTHSKTRDDGTGRPKAARADGLVIRVENAHATCTPTRPSSSTKERLDVGSEMGRHSMSLTLTLTQDDGTSGDRADVRSEMGATWRETQDQRPLTDAVHLLVPPATQIPILWHF